MTERKCQCLQCKDERKQFGQSYHDLIDVCWDDYGKGDW